MVWCYEPLNFRYLHICGIYIHIYNIICIFDGWSAGLLYAVCAFSHTKMTSPVLYLLLTVTRSLSGSKVIAKWFCKRGYSLINNHHTMYVMVRQPVHQFSQFSPRVQVEQVYLQIISHGNTKKLSTAVVLTSTADSYVKSFAHITSLRQSYSSSYTVC